MIWALVLYGIACLLGLSAAALSARPPMPARHRAPALEDRWMPTLGPGWLIHLDGRAVYVPSARRRDVDWQRVDNP